MTAGDLLVGKHVRGPDAELVGRMPHRSPERRQLLFKLADAGGGVAHRCLSRALILHSSRASASLIEVHEAGDALSRAMQACLSSLLRIE